MFYILISIYKSIIEDNGKFSTNSHNRFAGSYSWDNPLIKPANAESLRDIEGTIFLKACAAVLFILSVLEDMISPPVILLCGTKPK